MLTACAALGSDDAPGDAPVALWPPADPAVNTLARMVDLPEACGAAARGGRLEVLQ